MVDFSDGTLRREQDIWRERLAKAGLRYAEDRNEERRAEYLRTLRVFARLAFGDRTNLTD